MEGFRTIDVESMRAMLGEGLGDVGPAPILEWIDVTKLVLDPEYQREIGRSGAKNVLKIAREFDWTKFGSVIVAPIEGGLYAIVDGQHRTGGAMLRGIRQVPCMVILADRARQASAFAAINGAVTIMTPLQIHAARVAAGEPRAVALRDACREADVVVCRYPVPGNNMKPGETLAVGALYALNDTYGREVLVVALKCLTRGRGGNVGMIRAPVVKALCAVLDGEPSFRRSEAALFRAMAEFDVGVELEKAASDSRRTRRAASVVLSTYLYAFLGGRLGAAAA